MFQRNGLNQLRLWASKDSRKPLILRGARQVGKTTLINEFSKEFDTYLYLNLEDEGARDLFESKNGVDEILISIYLFCNKPRNDARTLLFIDEIQNSPKAVALLRYFYELLPQIYVVGAGSLLESLIDTHISFPVGRVEFLAVRPCSFHEFVGAMGETEIQKALTEVALPEMLHSKLINLFNTYTLIGGMPEIVNHYSKNRDLVSINDLYESLLTGYRDDVEKYAKNATAMHVMRHILQQGWLFAGQRISLAGFGGSSYKSREVGEAFRTLEKTMLLELVYPTIHTEMSIFTELKRSPKLFWLDSGLVNYSAKIQKEIFGSSDIMDAWRGNVSEQIVAQELLAMDYRVSHKRNFWVRDKHGSDAEIDFVIQYDNKIIPIEVKSGNNAKLRSLHIFMDGVSHNWAVRVWSNPLSIDEVVTPNGKLFKLINLPFYYVGMVEKVLMKIDV